MLRRLPGNRLALAGAALAALLTVPACSVNVKKGENGEEKKVDIETPVGGIHVGANVDPRDTGLPVYPGARMKPKGTGSDDNSANVNISSGLFGLKVAAIEYISDDPPDKLIAFYRDKLKQYGNNVLECHVDAHNDPSDVNVHIDDKDKKSHELTCSDKHGPAIELKVGTQENQHIVSIKPQDGGKGTDFGLVYVQVHAGDKSKDTI